MGAFWYFVIFGFDTLPGSHVGWLMNQFGDSFPHYLGWAYFRAAPWSFPLGSIPTLNHPIGTSITYTDSIPLASLALKLFSPWLNEPFQFFGGWVLISVILQFLFSVLILREYTPRWVPQVLGASLLVLSPCLIYRAFVHTALSSQWLILAGLYGWLASRRRVLPLGYWALLLVCTLGIHPYFTPMVLPFYGLYLWELAKKRTYGRCLAELALTGAACFLFAWVIGAIFNSGNIFLVSKEEVFGPFSANLNTFFNSMGLSSWLPGLPNLFFTQYEGFCYLGLGNLLLLLITLIQIIRYQNGGEILKKNRAVIGLCALFGLFAMLPVIALNQVPLLPLPIPEQIAGLVLTFRSTGRFVWPIFYLLVLFLIVQTVRRYRQASWILAGILLIQFLDLQPLFSSRRLEGQQPYASPLVSQVWSSAPASFFHLVLVPPQLEGSACFTAFAPYGAKNGMTINGGILTRVNKKLLEQTAQEELARVEQGNPTPQTMYVFCQPELAAQLENRAPGVLTYATIDGFRIGIPPNEDGLLSP